MVVEDVARAVCGDDENCMRNIALVMVSVVDVEISPHLQEQVMDPCVTIIYASSLIS